ncbi:MAG TPA: hypothetical protein VGG00_02680 [Rhodanobacter sp.]|jgi:ribosomal protein L7/L12
MHWNTIGSFAGIFCVFMVGYLLGRTSAARAAARHARAAWKPNPAISDADIEAEIRAGRKIEAIKLYRQRDGSGLKEARQAVDAMSATIGTRRA